jgi:hypothetical protein
MESMVSDPIDHLRPIEHQTRVSLGGQDDKGVIGRFLHDMRPPVFRASNRARAFPQSSCFSHQSFKGLGA